MFVGEQRATRHQEMEAFVDDLKPVASVLQTAGGQASRRRA